MSTNIEDCRKNEKSEKHKYWETHVTAWEQSGINQSEYCRSQGLSVKIFGYWKRKLKDKESDLTFVPVSIKPAQNIANKPIACLRLIIGSDYSVEISDGFNTDTLRRLLNTLGQRI